MAYVAGDTILDDEYQTFVASSSDPYGYNHFAGTGAGQYGLGQTHLVEVTPNATTITAAQWNALMTGIDNIANHTNDSMTARTAVVTGDTIAIKSAVAADLATLAASVAGGCVNATALSAGSELQSSQSSTRYAGSHTVEHTVTFANGNNLRFFFNAGGKIRIDPSCVTGIDGLKDDVFNDLTTVAIGNLDLGAHATTRSGSGETLTTNGLANGFHNLTTSYTTLIKLTSDNSGYTSNTLEIQAKLDAAVGTATVITIKMIAVDADNDDTYTAGNTDGVPANPNEAPRMTLALIEVYPTNGEGLSANIQSSSNAEVSNTAS